MNSALDTVLGYHQRTKHHLYRYAAGPHGLDWGSQPNAFRSFEGCARLELPLPAFDAAPLYTSLFQPGKIAAQALTQANIAALLAYAFGLSAWKQYGYNRWALRCNPSSGNLHPTEAYVITNGCDGIADGAHHYLSRDHVLEHRCHSSVALTPDAFLLGISSIHWREAWKYGERAYRYCQHDAGHAIAAARIAAAMLGWQVRLLDSWGDAAIAAALGLDRDQDFGEAEREHPDAMLLVTAGTIGPVAAETIVRAAGNGHWQGRANALSPYRLDDWPVIEAAAQACLKPATDELFRQPRALPEPLASPCGQSAATIVMQRRSAQAFDGVTSISAAAFYRMLDMTLPRSGVPPFDAIGWEARVHLALFVHRVDGLAPGLYVLLRNGQAKPKLRDVLMPEFEWLRPQGCPEHLTLYRLLAADARDAAQTLSCHQEIAADGAFSLGMLAEFEVSLTEKPWVYRQLFWEAGIIGQMFYLEAEAAGVRGTGIGCYFDDAVHELLGIKDLSLQSMYHFTVGGALTDTRLQTLPPYAHLQRNI
ncbi:MAG TPA: nitroreductase family protein [Novimethylophilus sp.]|uniref:nitroreductase family protein n=1 Tax=Novimethylophilus sp. TaxID=2137426 RepID=UPI002F403233